MTLLSQISQGLGLSEQYIEALARSASYRYKKYRIKKKTNGFREICHPSKELKSVQRWLLYFILSKWPIHDSATAYRENRSIVDNARIHAGFKFLLRMDFIDFFPSITSKDIASYWAKNVGPCAHWSQNDISLLQRLVCRNGKLTIGAPTSPTLSNAICFQLDTQLKLLASESKCVYTRYADDLFFSCNERDVLFNLENEISKICENISIPSNLKINKKKTRHVSRKHHRSVTGIVLTPTGELSVGRPLKRKIRASIHKFQDLSETDKNHLRGLIAYATNVDAEFLNSLILKYGFSIIQNIRINSSE